MEENVEMENPGPKPPDNQENEQGADGVTKARQPRKKKGPRRSLGRPAKQRGRYKAKSSTQAGTEEENLPGGDTIGFADNILADCLFSDEETKSQYIQEVNNFVSVAFPGGDVEESSDTLTSDSHSQAGSIDSPFLAELTSDHGQDIVVVAQSSVLPGPSTSSLPEPDFPIDDDVYETPVDSVESSLPSVSSSSETTVPTDFSHDDISSPVPLSESSHYSEVRESTSPSASPLPPPVSPPTLPPPPPPPSPPRAGIDAALATLKSKLPTWSLWFPVATWSGIHIFQLSQRSPKAIQKEVFMSYVGDETISVHMEPLKISGDILNSVSPPCMSLDGSTVEQFCQRAVNLVQRVNQYIVCVGANDDATKNVWSFVAGTYIDDNIFKEDSYKSTCRSTSCDRLVLLDKWRQKRCSSCAKVMKNLRRRGHHLKPEETASRTNYRYLTGEEKMLKLYDMRDEIRKKDRKILRLTRKLDLLLEDEGVDIDPELSDDLRDILERSKLSPMQQVFLEEQLKKSQQEDPRGHRWHPTMIRLSLHLFMKSRSTYEALRDSGAVKLPSSRTLFDYSHAFDPQPGVNDGIVKILAESLAPLKPHQQFVNLIGDEVHVSRNLVYRQADGRLIGYTHLDDLEQEMVTLEESMQNKETVTKKIHLANTILAFMAKSITSNVKHVVAAFPCNQLTKDMLFSRTWQVISRLERVGVKVLSVTADGCAVNRAFIAMHEPITKTESGVIFDTLNFCSKEERALYFVADVAHLLKTIRNCFYNSGEGPKKTRCMEINGEMIKWNTIVGLYIHHKSSTLRKSYKLNSQNVFPNSYSAMKVRLAAEVLSDTVALDLEQLSWPKTTETVRFIRLVNKFFDCLNGAHSSQHIKTRNANLKPYTEVSDARYDWLHNVFLKYLEDWKKQVKSVYPNLTSKEQDKKMLSSQTLAGIEMAIKGFTGATRYLIKVAKENKDTIFIMARAFSQDHLENYFSVQRGATGGSRNPNVAQFLGNQVSLSLQKGLGIPRKRGNVIVDEKPELRSEPLAKRPRKSRKVF